MPLKILCTCINIVFINNNNALIRNLQNCNIIYCDTLTHYNEFLSHLHTYIFMLYNYLYMYLHMYVQLSTCVMYYSCIVIIGLCLQHYRMNVHIHSVDQQTVQAYVHYNLVQVSFILVYIVIILVYVYMYTYVHLSIMFKSL